MTGAVVPDDCNTVIIQENVSLSDGRITLAKDVSEGANIRRKGEEIAAGDTVLTAGRILREADIMLLAALGYGEVPVHRKIRVALLSSGNELLEPGEPDTGRDDQIYDSNRAMLAARPCGSQDSHRILQVSRANAYLVIPAESGSLEAGESVTVQPFADAFL